MATRLTIDLQDPSLMKLLRFEAAEKNMKIREIIVGALKEHFSSKRENRAVAKLAEKAFAEWDNPEDSVYDKF